MMAGVAHISHACLADAKRDPEGIVVFEGDYGGQIYAVARASFVRCEESQLAILMAELDGLGWQDLEGAGVHFESQPIGSVVSGGMGGGQVASDVWVHPQLSVSECAVRAVLQGEARSVLQ